MGTIESITITRIITRALLFLLVIGGLCAALVELASAQQESAPVSRVIAVKGSLDFMHAGGEWGKARVGLRSFLGDLLRTGEKSTAALEFVIGGKVGLNHGTTIEITGTRKVTDVTPGGAVRRIVVKAGALWWKSAPLRENRLEFETRGGVLAIRGTEVVIHAAPGGDTLYLLSGLSGFLPPEGSGGAPGEYGQGAKISIPAGGAPSIEMRDPAELRRECESLFPELAAWFLPLSEPGIEVKLEVTDPVAEVGKVITGTFTVTGTEEPVRIFFINRNPDVAGIPGGNDQTVVSSGGRPNVFTFPIRALTGPRTYTISYGWDLKAARAGSFSPGWGKADLSAKSGDERGGGAPETAAPVSLPMLARHGDVDVSLLVGEGSPAATARLVVTNRSGEPLKELVPEALVLLPSNPGVQRLIIGKAVLVQCAPGSTATVPLEAFCIDYGKPLSPPAGAREGFSYAAAGDSDALLPLARIVVEGTRLSEEGAFPQGFHPPGKYRVEVIQRALWSCLDESAAPTGREVLREEIARQLASLPEEERPSEEERDAVADTLWEHVDLTLKKAGVPQ